MTHIFISYSRKNQPYARALADELLKHGFDVWIDDRIDYGDDWWQVIVKAIRECAAFVVIMTPESDASKWVQREVTLADHLPRPIFPVLCDGDLLSSDNWSIFLRTQYADVRDGSFPKADFYARLRRVVEPKASRGQEVVAAETKVQIPGETRQASSTASSTAPKKDTRTFPFPLIIKPDWVGKIIPEPFEWCVIPAGSVTFTDTGGYLKQATTTEVQQFSIARYPITNAQFASFVSADDGWRNAEWWDYSEASVKQRIQELEPVYSIFTGDTCPRETVTWYGAVAFTRWLSSKTGEEISLPTEQQWQRAAQGDDGRMYPWGNRWDSMYCNNSVNASSHTSTKPITDFSRYASPYGVIDMCGNVWEWCLTDYHDNNSRIDMPSRNRVLRGGSWGNDNAGVFRCAVRMWSSPESSSSKIGFRCAATWSSS